MYLLRVSIPRQWRQYHDAVCYRARFSAMGPLRLPCRGIQTSRELHVLLSKIQNYHKTTIKEGVRVFTVFHHLLRAFSGIVHNIFINEIPSQSAITGPRHLIYLEHLCLNF